MARQGILGGTPNPVFINETGLRDAGLPGSYIDETSVIDVSVTETASASEIVTAGAQYPVAVAESVTATDAFSATYDLGGIITETVTATDNFDVTADFNVSIHETATATDTETIDTTDYAVSIVEDVDARDFVETTAAGGGGGGAAGIFGIGEPGQTGNPDGTGGYGGAGDLFHTPEQLVSESTGNTGTEWDGTHGSGSGGSGGDWGGSGTGGNGGTGGLYGGGGGGGGAGILGGGLGALGGDGAIFIAYNPGSGWIYEILTHDSVSPYTFPADWSTTNQILLLGPGGCGGNGGLTRGGDGGGGGTAVGVTNTLLFNPLEELEFYVPTPEEICEGGGQTEFGDGSASGGLNGDNGDGTPHDPGGGFDNGFDGGYIYDPGDGGDGGVFIPLRNVNVSIEETAEATDEYDATVDIHISDIFVEIIEAVNATDGATDDFCPFVIPAADQPGRTRWKHLLGVELGYNEATPY